MDPFQHLDDYALLGVSPDATPDEIKQAYRREITTYHPDRFRGADAATQQYARERSQRITEAYATINRAPRSRAGARSAAHSPRTRGDQLAAEYDQALRVLAAGDAATAARLLREIQRVDPFYRDIDEQLARADSMTGAQPSRRPPLLLWLGAGLACVVALLGGVYAFNIVGASSTAEDPPAVVVAGNPDPVVSPSAIASPAAVIPDLSSPSAASIQSAAPDELVVPVEPTTPAVAEPTSVPPTPIPATETPVPTDAPTNVPPQPTQAPRATQPAVVAAPAPSVAPRPPATLEGGALLVSDTFDDPNSGWPVQQTNTYSLGYRDGSYAISSQPGTGAIFAYGSPLDRSDVIVGANVTPVRGAAGLIFGPENSYRFLVSGDGRYRVEQRGNVIVPPTRSNAIRAGANRLVVAAVGQRASLYANGVLLANLDLPSPLRGTTYGFVVVAGQGGGEGVFDDLTVRGLPR